MLQIYNSLIRLPLLHNIRSMLQIYNSLIRLPLLHYIRIERDIGLTSKVQHQKKIFKRREKRSKKDEEREET